MTTPATTAPLAPRPPIGLSEITTLIVLLGAILTGLFGRDWGVTANAQHYAGIAVVLLPIALSIARAIKHVGNVQAAATVIAASTPPPVTPAAPAAALPAQALDADADPYPGDETLTSTDPEPVTADAAP